MRDAIEAWLPSIARARAEHGPVRTSLFGADILADPAFFPRPVAAVLLHVDALRRERNDDHRELPERAVRELPADAPVPASREAGVFLVRHPDAHPKPQPCSRCGSRVDFPGTVACWCAGVSIDGKTCERCHGAERVTCEHCEGTE